jgi:DNA-binding XRE family transcriptional regulator
MEETEMKKIMTQEDVLRRLEKKYPGIGQKVQEELAALRIAYKITELRQRHHLTQAELAQRAGLKQSNLARMEQPGYVDYKITTLSKIARAARTHLNVSFA